MDGFHFNLITKICFINLCTSIIFYRHIYLIFLQTGFTENDTNFFKQLCRNIVPVIGLNTNFNSFSKSFLLILYDIYNQWPTVLVQLTMYELAYVNKINRSNKLIPFKYFIIIYIILLSILTLISFINFMHPINLKKKILLF